MLRAGLRQRTEGNKIAGRRGIRLDMQHARRLELAASRNGEALPAFAHNVNAKACQQLERNLDVGARDQLAHHVNPDVLTGRGQGQGHQQCRQKLA